MTLKDYTKCNTLKPFKECSKSRYAIYRTTRDGLATKIYANQKRHSEQREHPMPDYTKEELKAWLLSQDNFEELFFNWAESGYQKMLVPSCDRLDDYKPYALNNLQLVTWAENNQKGFNDRVNGINNKISKAVIQLTKEGVIINKYHSQSQAGRDTGINFRNISACCNGKQKTAGGFKWLLNNKQHI